MIFTTQNKELVVLGKTIDDIKNKIMEIPNAWKRGKINGEYGIRDTLFSGKTSKNILTPELLDEFEAFKDLFNEGHLSAEVLAEDIPDLNRKILDYAKTCKNGEMTTAGFKASLEKIPLSAKLGAVSLQALATAGNMLLMYGISKGIELVATGIDNLVHSAEHCKERVDELMSSYESAIGNANDNARTVESFAARYEELSRGVNNFGRNLSLTTDEYAEYCSGQAFL